MSNDRTAEEWDRQAAMLADDGYDDATIARALGARPGQPRANGAHQGASGRHAGLQGVTEALTVRRNVASTKALGDRVRDRRLKPAPGIETHGKRAQLSWGGKVERLAEAMCRLRGMVWEALPEKEQKKFYALADFVLRAVDEVEKDEIRLRKPERILPQNDPSP